MKNFNYNITTLTQIIINDIVLKLHIGHVTTSCNYIAILTKILKPDENYYIDYITTLTQTIIMTKSITSLSHGVKHHWNISIFFKIPKSYAAHLEISHHSLRTTGLDRALWFLWQSKNIRYCYSKNCFVFFVFL